MPSVLPPVSGFDPSLSAGLLTREGGATGSAPAAQDAGSKLTSGQPVAISPAHAVGTQFEAMFLRQVLEDMLPKNADSVFGSGTAGGIWRSMLAENLANTLAERNTLGLAKTIAASTEIPGKSISE